MKPRGAKKDAWRKRYKFLTYLSPQELVSMCKNKEMKKILTTSSLLLLLTACSSSPGNSDLEDAIETQYLGCENVSIEDIKKINGYEEDEKIYNVEYSYRIEFDEDKLAEIKDIFTDFKKQHAEWASKYEERSKRLSKINGEIHEERVKALPSPKFQDAWAKFPNLNPEDYSRDRHLIPQEVFDAHELHEQEWKIKIKEFEESHPLAEEKTEIIKHLENRPKGPGMDEMQYTTKTFLSGCKNQSGMKLIREAITKTGMNVVFGSGKKSDLYNIKYYDISGNILMRKTDNGWKPA